jgi:hypothetical protein
MLIRFSMVSILVAGLGSAGLALAAADDGQPDTSVASASVYQLPKVGKPTGRLGGGRRGVATDAPEVYALVPDHVGYTASQQPALFWFMSEGAAGELKFELTLIDESSIDPVIDSGFAMPKTPGLQRIDLAKHGVSLAAGEEYQWSIALVTDDSDRSKDIVSSGWIERVPASSELAARVTQAGPSGAAAVYGAEGLWYDTLEAAFDQMQRSPADSDSRQQLAGMLTGVGLPDEAARP